MAKGKKPTPQEIYWERKRKDERERAALLPAGFVNHGNTCFMNSILQGLVATPLLEDLVRFRSPELLRPMASRRSPVLTNGRGPPKIQQDWVQGMSLGDAFILVLERSWRIRDIKERSSLSPKDLLSRLGAKYDQYLDFRQQDAHEFLLHLLDGMRMEEFDVIKQRQPPPAPLSKSKSRTRVPNGVPYVPPEPIPEEDRLTSFVDMAFGGRLASVLICESCKHVSHTYEGFDDLSLSITHDESKERMRDRLRTFASKFISTSNRSRGQTISRPPSFSQPPSPPLPATTLDVPAEAQEAPRRRSLEDPLPLDSDIPKIDIFSGFDGATGIGAVGETSASQSRGRSRKPSDAGLGKLGRRLSASMALSGKKEKRPSKVERDPKIDSAEGININGKDRVVNEERTHISAPTSRPPSRQLSPTPSKQSRKARLKPLKLSEHEKRKAVYLRRLLEDPIVTLSNPLTLLRAGGPTGSGISAQWPKVGSVQSIEDCLKMFTAVEVLDGDNMVRCRNCWKIANGQRPERHNTQSEPDTASSEEEEERRTQDELPRTEIVESAHSLSMPTLSTGENDIMKNPPHPMKATLYITPSDIAPLEANVAEQRHMGRDQKTHNAVRIPQIVEDASLARHFASEPRLPIPTITAVSPTSDLTPDLSSTSTLHTQGAQVSHLPRPFYGHAVSSRDSLQLPSADTHRRRDASQQGGLSSDESDDTSGISDGDASVASASNNAVSSRPHSSGVPRSKQVVLRRALKRYLIASPPPILVVHLKRFQQVSKSPVTLFSNLKKLDEYVSFPEYLDIRPFLAPKKEDYGLGKGELRGKVTEKGQRAEDRPCAYRLYAVIVHIGNMLGGHYIAYTALPSSPESFTESRGELNGHSNGVSFGRTRGKEDALGSVVKKERQWCYISDTVVRLASLDEVLKSKAYICMYERLP